MSWEYGVIVVLILMAMVHLCLARTYSRRIMQLGMEVAETELEISSDGKLDEVLTDGVRMLAQAEADRTGNRYALVIDAICIGVLIILAALHYMAGVAQVGWMSLLFLPLPAFMLRHHLGNTHIFPVKRRSLWSGLSAHSR